LWIVEVDVRGRVIVVVFLVIAALAVPMSSVASPRQQSAALREESRFLNSNLVQVAQVPGTIQDLSAARVLYLDSSSASPALTVRDRGTGVDTTLPQVPNQQITQGWLTLTGVFLRTSDQRLYEWTSGAGLTALGTTSGPVLVRGSYAAWGNSARFASTSLYRRDFTTGQTVEVARAGNLTGAEESLVLSDLAANGDVVYGRQVIEQIWFSIAQTWINRYHNGATEEIIGDDSAWVRLSPTGDDTAVAYRKIEKLCAHCGTPRSVVAMHDGTREIDLTPLMDDHVYPGGDYDSAGGWVAFKQHRLEFEHAQLQYRRQIWRRGLSGSATLVAETIDANLNIVSLGSDGQILYAVEPGAGPASLYLFEVGKPPVLLASGWGAWTSRYGPPGLNFARRIDGRWQLAIGGTLYALTEGAPATLTVEVEGSGAVTVAPYGQTCRTTCALPYAAGAEVTLTATAEEGWRFEKWSGACSGATGCSTRLLEPVTVRAHFFVPAQSTPPVSVLPRGRHLSAQTPAAIPLLTVWKSTSPHGALSAEELQVSVNNGGFAPVPLPGATISRAESSVVATATYQFRARALDAQSRPGDWANGSAFTVDAVQETVATYTGGWTTREASSAWGGSVSSTDHPSASATMTFTGQEFAIVGSASRKHGSFDIYVDGTLRETVTPRSWSWADRRILASFSLTSGTHTVRIVRASTGQGPIELDGFVVLR
jgi:Divergent InlB B-repeat domain